MASDNATEEFKRISEFMRTYLLLRLYRLTLLLGTSGAIITALVSDNVRRRGAVVILLLKLGALGISTAFAVMDFSAGGHWIRLRERANELAALLGYRPFPNPSRWSPFTATGARNYLHVFVVLLWAFSLFLNPQWSGQPFYADQPRVALAFYAVVLLWAFALTFRSSLPALH